MQVKLGLDAGVGSGYVAALVSATHVLRRLTLHIKRLHRVAGDGGSVRLDLCRHEALHATSKAFILLFGVAPHYRSHFWHTSITNCQSTNFFIAKNWLGTERRQLKILFEGDSIWTAIFVTYRADSATPDLIVLKLAVQLQKFPMTFKVIDLLFYVDRG